LVFDPDSVSPKIRDDIQEVVVEFTPDGMCEVCYEFVAKPRRGKKPNADEDDEEGTDWCFYEQFLYDDPRLLAKIFRAIAKLGVYVPPTLGPAIRQAQQSLTGSVQPQAARNPNPSKRRAQ
jgi:hypothetical protein